MLDPDQAAAEANFFRAFLLIGPVYLLILGLAGWAAFRGYRMLVGNGAARPVAGCLAAVAWLVLWITGEGALFLLLEIGTGVWFPGIRHQRWPQ